MFSQGFHTSRSNIKTLIANPPTPNDTTVTSPAFEDGKEVLSVSPIKGIDYTISPNPTSNQLFVKLNDQILKSKVIVTNTNGKEVFIKKNNHSSSFTVPTSKLSSGAYFIHVEVNGVVTTKRFLVKN